MDKAGLYVGDADLQLERINVYFNEAAGGGYFCSAPDFRYVAACFSDAGFALICVVILKLGCSSQHYFS